MGLWKKNGKTGSRGIGPLGHEGNNTSVFWCRANIVSPSSQVFLTDTRCHLSISLCKDKSIDTHCSPMWMTTMYGHGDTGGSYL